MMGAALADLPPHLKVRHLTPPGFQIPFIVNGQR